MMEKHTLKFNHYKSEGIKVVGEKEFDKIYSYYINSTVFIF